MSSFEDIPEDKEESYRCQKCKNGNVVLNDDRSKWICDTCNVVYKYTNKGEEK